MEHAGVGDQHHLHVGQLQAVLDRGAGGDDLVEVAVGRRLAVAAEGNVVQPPQVLAACRRTPACSNNSPERDQPQHLLELGQQLVHLDEPRFALPGAIDLAIDAIEVADLVGIQIHADRDSARPPAEHGIDKAVRVERTLVVRVQRMGLVGWEFIGRPGGGRNVREYYTPRAYRRSAKTKPREASAGLVQSENLPSHEPLAELLQLGEFVHRDRGQLAVVAA